MRRLLAGIVCLALSSATFAPALADDLVQRPDVVSGELPNGLRYIVLHHANPPGRAAVWMQISSGSLNEQDEQRGLAHFLEHMAFNGSKNFHKNEVVAFFESMGLTFGQHQNAFTSFEQTTYQLALPDNKTDSLAKAFTFFSDVLFNLSLDPEEIENERQIILEEKNRGLGADQRIFDYTIERMLPGSRVAQRLPIGINETIGAVNRDNFLAYYTQWYRPSNTTVIVVADMDPQAVVAEITRAFSGGERTDRPVDMPGGVKPYESAMAIVATDPELTQADIDITRVMEVNPPTLTTEQMRDELVDTLATMTLNRRIAKRVQAGDESFLRGNVGVSDAFMAFRQTSANATGEPAKWKDMLQDIATEVKRATLYGFDATEIADTRSDLLSRADLFAQREATANARQLLAMMNNAIANGEPVLSASQRRDLMHEFIPSITDEEVNARFKSLFDTEAVAFIVTMPSGDNVPTEQDVLDVGLAALRATPEPIQFADRPTTILSQAPTPGEIVERTTHDATGVETAWLSNNTAVHHRFMDYKKDAASIIITLAGGVIEEHPDQRGLTEMASLAFTNPAARSRSSTNIQDLLVGKKVSVGGMLDRDTITIRVSGDPDDLEPGMQVAYLLLTEPLVEEVTAKQWVTQYNQAIDERKTNAQGVSGELMSKLMSPPGEERLRQLEHEDVDRLSVPAAQAWIDRIVREAPIEVAIVGDIDEAKAMELVKTYIGSLPSRPRISTDTLASLRNIQRPVGPLAIDETIVTSTPVAMVRMGSFGPDWGSVDDRRKLNMASQILTSRMIKRIREQEQLVYGIGVRVSPSMAFKGYGLITASATTDPEKATRLAEVVHEMMSEFAKSGPTDEEMHIARGQIANLLDEQMREPMFWEMNLDDMTLRGTSLDDVNAGITPYDDFTADEIRDAVARYYSDDARFSVIVRPDPNSPAAPKPGQ